MGYSTPFSSTSVHISKSGCEPEVQNTRENCYVAVAYKSVSAVTRVPLRTIPTRLIQMTSMTEKTPRRIFGVMKLFQRLSSGIPTASRQSLAAALPFAGVPGDELHTQSVPKLFFVASISKTHAYVSCTPCAPHSTDRFYLMSLRVRALCGVKPTDRLISTTTLSEDTA